MPRLPDYQASVGLNPGSTPQVRTGGEAIGQGLQALGSGLDQAAAGLAHYQREQEQLREKLDARRKQETAFDDDNKFSLYKQQRQNAYQAAKQNMPAEATGFAASWAKGNAKPDTEFLATISEGNRAKVAGQLLTFNEDMLGGASRDEYTGRATFEGNAINQKYQGYLTTIARNPDQRDTVLSDLNDTIDKASSLTAQTKLKMKQDVLNGVSYADFQARYGADPEGAKRALGRSTTTAGTPEATWQAMLAKENATSDPAAVSSKGALGVAQVMPGTARDVAKKLGLTNVAQMDDQQLHAYFAAHPDVNHQIGRAYFDEQLSKYGGDQEAAVIAYNAGPAVADDWIKAGRNDGMLPKETQDYKATVLKNSGGDAEEESPENLPDASGAIPRGATPDTVGLMRHLVPGKGGDHISGMQKPLQSGLQAMFDAAPAGVKEYLQIMSGYRSPERQKQLWEAALQKYGSADAARKWVAPPGNSQHNHGNAADLAFDGAGTTAKLSPAGQAAMQWAHANAGRFGLAFPLANEPWHVEVAGARGKTAAAIGAINSAPDPRYSSLTLDQQNSLIDSAERERKQLDAASAANLQKQFLSLQNTLQNQLQDGQAGMSEINQARQQGWLSDADTVSKFTKIVQDRDKDIADTRTFFDALNSGQKLNPFNADDKKVADAGFKALGGDIDALNTVYGSSGILPPSGVTALRGALISKDSGTVGKALTIASNALARDPNAFTAVDGGNAIENKATTFNHLVNDRGIPTAEAVRQIMEADTPEYKSKIRVDDQQQRDFMKEITPDTIAKQFSGWQLSATNPRGIPNFGSSPTQAAVMMRDFKESALKHYKETGDADLSVKMAKSDVDKTWGVTNVFGTPTLVNFPVEKTYPGVGVDPQGSHNYVMIQATHEISKQAGQLVAPEHLIIAPIPDGSTAQAYYKGQPAPYNVGYMAPDENGYMVPHMLPSPMTFDPNEGHKRAMISVGPAIDARNAQERSLQNDVQMERDLYLRNQPALNPAATAREKPLGQYIQKPLPKPFAPSAPPTSGNDAFQKTKEEFEQRPNVLPGGLGLGM